MYLRGNVQLMGSTVLNLVSSRQSTSCCFFSYPARSSENYSRLSVSKALSSPSVQTFHTSCFGSGSSGKNGSCQSFTVKGLFSSRGSLRRHLNVSLQCQNLNMRLSLSRRGMLSKLKGNVGSVSWSHEYASAGLILGLLVCHSSSEPTHAHAEAAAEKKDEDDSDLPYVRFSHGKKVYTDYSVIGIPGDGRCLFRSVSHGACLRAGQPAPSGTLQRDLADNLRARVADEFIKRREETEWFVEGDFDTYVAQMRKPHVWGGEPELFMASHVLKMPINVYMYDQNAGGLISIAEYGQEYGKDNPIRVLYHGSGHYDALQIPGRKGAKSKL
ncbi:OVARIAN TUMOR DOMAIN-containing deubiquitinating enzyme 4-like isoform X2 [Euphorbia lathyris]|uniref:OVARIAN TUMOR DOMAIN-containing deubiquitinating enzyme 4-like isoform X2 n=1 Tax=Euphorbia lathyris TaxID=212925 RepID=UPI0033134C5B